MENFMKSLDKLRVGERAYIVEISNNKLQEKLFEMGILPGDEVIMKVNSEKHNSVIVSVRGQTFNLFKPAAETIITRALSFEFSLN
jgi:Fe2+ transport system protein FeoA